MYLMNAIKNKDILEVGLLEQVCKKHQVILHCLPEDKTQSNNFLEQFANKVQTESSLSAYSQCIGLYPVTESPRCVLNHQSSTSNIVEYLYPYNSIIHAYDKIVQFFCKPRSQTIRRRSKICTVQKLSLIHIQMCIRDRYRVPAQVRSSRVYCVVLNELSW